MPEVLVTGATGFIGRQLVENLLHSGHHVRALVRDLERARTLLPAEVELRLGDVLDSDALGRSTAGTDQVFHLASLLKMPWHKDFSTINTEGTRRLAEACTTHETPPRLVIISSLAAAGPSPPDRPAVESQPAVPVSRYGRVKLEAEQAARSAAPRLPICIVRPPMVFGPHDKSALELYRTISKGLHFVPTRATHHLSMIHVEDLALALVAIGARGESTSPEGPEGRGLYYVADPHHPSYGELGLMIAKSMEWPTPRVLRLPSAITWLAALGSETVARLRDQPTILNLDKAREARAGSWICSGEKLERGLGISHQRLETRLAETGAWYLQQGWL